MRVITTLVLCLLPTLVAAQPIQVLDTFTPSPGSPSGALIQVPDGSFYGPLAGGVYRIAPGGQVTVAPGAGNAVGALVRGPDGALYGTSNYDGANRRGTVFRVDPVTLAASVLHSFGGANEGSNPLGGLVVAGGLLYGVTPGIGGFEGQGTLFRLDPATGAFAILHNFVDRPAPAAWFPNGPLALGPDGRLYGTTRFANPQESGAIYRYDPASGVFAIVHQFVASEGVGPTGPLRLDVDGLFYGSALGGGGAEGAGTIFRFNPATDALTVLYTLNPANGTDGRGPGPLVVGVDGHLYGTTQIGNAIAPNQLAPPTLFRLRRLGGGSVAYDTLRSFDAPATTGSAPGVLLTAGADNLIYGYAPTGGPAASGTIFRFDPLAASPPPITVLSDFRPTTYFAPSRPATATDGFLYGTTEGGPTMRGGVYRLNTLTGEATVIGDLPGGFAATRNVVNTPLMDGLDGFLYGSTTSISATAVENRIVRVSQATGAITAAVTVTRAATTFVLFSRLVRNDNGQLFGLRYEGGGTFVFRFDQQSNAVIDVAQTTLTRVSDLLSGADGRLYVSTVRQSTGFVGTLPVPKYDADVQRVNPTTGTLESVVPLARNADFFDAGAPVQQPGGAPVLYVPITSTTGSAVQRIDLAAATAQTVCAGVGSLAAITAVPTGVIAGTAQFFGLSSRLFGCAPDTGATVFQIVPDAVGFVAGDLLAVGVRLYGATSGGASGGGALFRQASQGTLPGLDSESDGLPNEWETAYGLDPFDATGDNGASGDPDGDGRSNAQELAEGTHPRGFFTRYFAEGASNAFFRTHLDLVNPSGATTALVRASFLTDAGATVRHDIPLAAGGRTSFDPATLPGLSGTSYSSVIESDLPIGVDRRMEWDATGYGSTLETGIVAPSTTWYFAEGSTSGDFALFYLLQNPQATAVTATVRFLRPSGAPIERTFTLPAASRTTIPVDDLGAALASTDLSATVAASGPIVAERAMYLSRNGVAFSAGHESAGVTAPATTWFLAEGATGPFFDLFVLIANPGTVDATVEVEYLLPGGGTLTRTRTIPAGARVTIWVDDEELPVGSGQKPLANAAVSTTVRSTNAVPIVVERSMWWPGPAVTADYWYEAHNSPGATDTATRWVIGGGQTGGPATAETYVLIANPTPTAGRARISVYLDEGSLLPLVHDVDLPAKSRTNVPIAATFFLTGERQVGIVVESLGLTPVPIVVEHATYSSPGGVTWAAGGNALAAPLP
jgi:uncharacterized repeat protein (TIGR03803 family)